MGVITNLILITGNIKLGQAEQKRICSVGSANLTNISYSIFDQSLNLLIHGDVLLKEENSN